MIVAFHQPNFLPNLGFYYKMVHSDIFVVATNIQFAKGEGWQRRHKIPTTHGDHWLTVPVRGSQNQRIKDVRIDDTSPWQRKHVKVLELTYHRTPESQVLADLIDLYMTHTWTRLVDLNMAVIELVRRTLDIKTPVVLDEDTTGCKEELIARICKKHGAQTYLSGAGGRNYLTPERLAALNRHGVRCRFVTKNVTAEFPYAAIHYILTDGRAAVRQVLR